MSIPSRHRLVEPSSLPHVWRGPELAGTEETVVSTGHAALDEQLPGGGWPVGSLVELLQDQASRNVWQLLLPGLSTAIQESTGPVVLVGAPYPPFSPSLSARGLPAERLLCIKAEKPAARLWACEQALKCADVAAVMAWLPRARSAELRRLHMAAQQHGKLLFVFRGEDARTDSSPARLRLLLQGTDCLRVRILKRRGPTLEKSIELKAQPRRLSELLDARKRPPASQPVASPVMPLPRRSHVLDRTAAIP